MRRDTMDRLMIAMRNARTVGAEVSESGQPRGERRIYTLRQADGALLETANLGRIETRIAKLRNAPAAGATVKEAKTVPAKQFDKLQAPIPVGWQEIKALQEKAIDRLFAAKKRGIGVRLSADEVHALCTGALGNAAPI